MESALESLLFVRGDEGLSLEQIKDIFKIDDKQASSLITNLINEYNETKHGIMIVMLGNSYKFVTKPAYKTYIDEMIKLTDDNLTEAGLETLAIIAYNQPVTRSQISEIRGVDCAHITRKLELKGLIREKGRSDLPGRPILYEVTNAFLDYFNLASINDLPKVPEAKLNSEETDLYECQYEEKE